MLSVGSAMSRRAVSSPSADRRGLRPPRLPRARAAARPARVRSRSRLRSISANTAPICSMARPHDRGGVDPVLERAQADAVALEALQEAHELVGGAPQPVEAPDHERVAATQVGEGGGEAGPVGARAGGAVLEGAMATGTGEGVALKVEPLILGG